MKNKKFLLSALFALGCLVSANAQVSTAPSDLILGFSASSGTNSTNSLEINLGSASSLVALSGGSEHFFGQSVVSLLDLQAYGSSNSWQNTLLTWGVVGATDTGDAKIWGTVKSGSTVGNPGANQGTPSNLIQTMVSALNGATATINSAAAASVVGTNAWKNKATGSLNFSYTPWNGKLVQSTSALLTNAFESSSLYAFNEAGSADLLGTFKLYQNGDFSFTSVIPEPSTYAALLGVATLGFVAIRRRKQQQLLA